MWYIVAFAVGMLVGCGAAIGEIRGVDTTT